MGLFSRNDKSEEPKGKPLDFDPLNVQIRDLRKGFFVDYNLKTWEITEGFEIASKDYGFKVLKLDAADEVRWLAIENGADTFIAQSLAVNSLDPEIPGILQNFGKAPAVLSFREIQFSCSYQGEGKCRDLAKNAMDWNRATCWKYSGNDGQDLIWVLQKGASIFEAWEAKRIDPLELSNFLPKY